MQRSLVTVPVVLVGSLCASDMDTLFPRAALSTEVNRDEIEKIGDAPKPIVKIDNQHDPFATVVSIQYGNRLGELLDTVRLYKPCCCIAWCVPVFAASLFQSQVTNAMCPACSVHCHYIL